MKKITFQTARLLFFGLGLFLLWGLIQKIGWSSIKIQLLSLHWAWVPVLLTGFLWYLCYTSAWQQIVRAQGRFLPFWHLFKAKIAGEMINTIQPANFLGGDPMRIYLLRRNMNITCLAASVVVDRTVNSMAIVSVIFLGAIVGFATFHGIPKEVVLFGSLFLLLSTALIVFFLLKQKRGLFVSILQLAKKFHIATHKVEKVLPKAIELDEKVLKFYEESHLRFWKALSFHILGRLLGIVEIYFIGKAIQPDFSFLIALFLATLSPIINMTFTLIPGALGVMEGAYSAALYLLGSSPVLGITIQMIKRIRSLLWIGLGLIILWFFQNPKTDDLQKDPLQQSLQSSL